MGVNMPWVGGSKYHGYWGRAPTTLKSEGEVTLSGADKREVRDNREKWIKGHMQIREMIC
jgi:hypothetical protein